MRPWLKISLIASLAGNLFLGGVLVGGGFRPPMKPPFGPHNHEQFEKQLATLSKDDQAILRAVFDGPEGKGRKGFDAIDDLRRRSLEALRAEPFDPAALRAVFEAMDVQFQALGRERLAGFVAAAEKLSPEGRKVLAEFGRGPMPPPPPR